MSDEQKHDKECESCHQTKPGVRTVNLGEWCMPFDMCLDCCPLNPEKAEATTTHFSTRDWRER